MRHNTKLPNPYNNVKDRLKELDGASSMKGYTLLDTLDILTADCSVGSNELYNYHNNYDDSEDVLKVWDKHYWWTPSYNEIKELQVIAGESAIKSLELEIKRIKQLLNENNK